MILLSLTTLGMSDFQNGSKTYFTSIPSFLLHCAENFIFVMIKIQILRVTFLQALVVWRIRFEAKTSEVMRSNLTHDLFVSFFNSKIFYDLI